MEDSEETKQNIRFNPDAFTMATVGLDKRNPTFDILYGIKVEDPETA